MLSLQFTANDFTDRFDKVMIIVSLLSQLIPRLLALPNTRNAISSKCFYKSWKNNMNKNEASFKLTLKGIPCPCYYNLKLLLTGYNSNNYFFEIIVCTRYSSN